MFMREFIVIILIFCAKSVICGCYNDGLPKYTEHWGYIDVLRGGHMFWCDHVLLVIFSSKEHRFAKVNKDW